MLCGTAGRGLRGVACAMYALRPLAVPCSISMVTVLGISATEAMAQSRSGEPAASGIRGVVKGVVRDESGRPLAGARIAVIGRIASIGRDAESESDERGAYDLAGAGVGRTLIVVRRIGFRPETLSVDVPSTGSTAADAVLRRLAMQLDAVLVNGRQDLRGPIAGFYERMERGNGRFFTQDGIARRNPARMSDLLRGIPGMRVEQRRGGAQQFRIRGASIAPLVWLDGTPMGAGEVDLDNFDPRSFAGIEIYSGAATVPVQFGGSRTMSTSGGAVVLWTRQGTAGPPRRKKGAPTPALLVASLIERGEVLTAASVDVPARPTEDLSGRPVYPDSLYAARLPGRVEVEFVVDADGRVRMDTFSVISTTHRLLGEPVRRALELAGFVPAVRGGRRVSQVVQLPFDFVPDSAAAARKPKD